jgi:hypothetical protein
MSAASSGFELPYVIVPIKEEDQDGLRKGAKALQKADICWHPNRAFEDWWVKKVDRAGDKYTVAPLRGRWACGLQRTVPRRILDTDYKVRVRRPC